MIWQYVSFNHLRSTAFTWYIVWIIVVDFQPIECITVLTSDRDTHIFWKIHHLRFQGINCGISIHKHKTDMEYKKTPKWIKGFRSGHLSVPHPSSDSPCSHHPDAVVPQVMLVALAVVRLRHKGRAAVQQHVVNHVNVFYDRFNLESSKTVKNNERK